MTTTLLLGGRVHAPAAADADAMAVRDGTVLWVGSAAEGRSLFGSTAEEVLRLDGAFVAPAFVDCHVHATSAGLQITGLDLAGCGSLAECLAAVRRAAAQPATADAAVLWGHGWDETRWPERRPPTRAELDDAGRGRALYLSRIDVHSALVTSPLATRAAGLAGYSEDGPLSREAHHAVRRAATAALTAAQRRAAQRAFLDLAASRGIGCVHECAGPDISGVDDLRDLLAAAGPDGVPLGGSGGGAGRDGAGGPDVVGYWAELVGGAEQAREVLAATGAHGLAGDLFADGALGSRTAALHEPYLDAPATRGAAYLDAGQIADHVVACTEAGVQAGFHVIGDAAVTAAVDGFTLAARRLGAEALAARGHRLEHLEMVDAAQAAVLARCGVLASVQPQFDASWGGTGGMYAQRLGAERAARMNPFAALAAAGVTLAFGSDTPVTPADPWASVRAAVEHHTAAARLPVAAAFAAHTVGGHRAAGPAARDAAGDGSDGSGGSGGSGGSDRAGGPADAAGGMLVPGAPASYAVWDTHDLATAVAGPSPRCLRTVLRGKTIFPAEEALRA